MTSVFVKEDKLSYGGYDVIKLRKKVKIEQVPNLTEVTYAVLKKNGKVLAKFDGAYSGYGNGTHFGLFSFLGGDKKQLVISQTIPRGGRHWVVELVPSFRIIYDSREFRVGREDLEVLDIDKDGRYEILQEITAFYGFRDLAPVETPLPTVIFRFDEKANKYLPANRLFQDFALNIRERDIASLNTDESEYLPKRLDIALNLIFAGKENEAWEFFDRSYKRPDKEEIKSQTTALLRNHPVYKFIYRKHQRT